LGIRKTPLLSIVTMVYTESRLKFLWKLLDSISRQTSRDFETLVVVECRTGLLEETKKILTAAADAKASVIPAPRSTGASACRNIGAKSSSGRIVCFVDDDVILDVDWARRIVSVFESGKLVALAGGAVPLWENPRDSWFPKSLDWIVSCTTWYGNEIRKTVNMWTMNAAIDRQVFVEVGGFNESLGPLKGREAGYSSLAEDLEFSLRLHAAGYKVYFVPWVSCGHLVQHSQVSLQYIIRRSVWVGFERRLLLYTGGSSPSLALSAKDLAKSCFPSRGDFRNEFRAKLAIYISMSSALYGFLFVRGDVSRIVATRLARVTGAPFGLRFSRLMQNKRAEQAASGDTLMRLDEGIWQSHDRYKEDDLRAANLLGEKGKMILDFGCGPGTLGAVLARKNTVFGFDIAAQAVRVAVRRARSERLDFSGAIMDGEFQGFAPAKFDIALSAWALHHFPDLKVPLGQLSKCLKPGGRLVVIEPNETALSQRVSRVVENRLRLLVLSSGLDTPNRTTHTRDEYTDALRDAGFKVVQVFSHYNGERPEIPNDISGGRRVALELLISIRRIVFTIGSWFGSGAEIFIIANRTPNGDRVL
jgi:2-polyprenyl-3-methyl-5-hydroxy-6-metoxy-1,4-benzoquinol methylase/glycosyltransferase involved in cell wall biosynthesis